MYYYIIPFLVYIFTISFTSNNYLLVARVVILSMLIIAFKRYYKFKLKLEALPVIIGIAIFLFWILLEDYYPHVGTSGYIPADNVMLIFRLLAFVAIAPVIEEFFVRNFLARILIKTNWKSVKLGAFTAASFIITAAFFGFSHNRWLPGLIAGILLNYLIYKKRTMGSVIIAHATANVLLAFYIIYTQSWFFW